jgi:hypothetical protein
MGAALTHGGVARPKAAAVVKIQGQQPCGGGACHHDDYGDDGVGRRLRAEAP